MKIQIQILLLIVLALYHHSISGGPQYVLKFNNSEIIDSIYENTHSSYYVVSELIELIEHPKVLNKINDGHPCAIIDSVKLLINNEIEDIISKTADLRKQNEFNSCLCRCAIDTLINYYTSQSYVFYCGQVLTINSSGEKRLLEFDKEHSDLIELQRRRVLFKYKFHDYSARNYEAYIPIKSPLFKVRCFNDLIEYKCEGDTIASVIKMRMSIDENDSIEQLKILEFRIENNGDLQLITNQFGREYFVALQKNVKNRKFEVENNERSYMLSGEYETSKCALQINHYRIELISIE